MYQESGINPFFGLENKYPEKLRDFLKVNQLLRDEAGTLFIFCFAMLSVTYSNYYVKIHLVAMHRSWEIAWKEWVSQVMFLYLVYVTWYHHWVLFLMELSRTGRACSEGEQYFRTEFTCIRLDTNTTWEIFVLLSREVK